MVPPEDLLTAILRFSDEGEVLAGRCRSEGHAYLGSVLSGLVVWLQEAAGHETSRKAAK